MTDDKVHSLFSKEPIPEHNGAPDPEVIALLEELLADARAGQCIGIAFVAFAPSLLHRRGCMGKISITHMLGALKLLEMEIIGDGLRSGA